MSRGCSCFEMPPRLSLLYFTQHFQSFSGMLQVQNKAPGILANAGVWGTHMGVSSNVRYQLLNGLDMVRGYFPP